MKFSLVICFCTLSIVSVAQKKQFATLRLIYPVGLAYDTLSVRGSDGKVLSKRYTLAKGGIRIINYLVNMNSSGGSSFSIYFGGSLSGINDTLYFRSRGSDLQIDIKEAFTLRERIDLKLQNVYNFEELHKRYSQYFNSRMQKYDSIKKTIPDYKLSREQYSLRASLDFVKKNVPNPYTIDLFAFFVIGPKSYANYDEIYKFYIKNLRNNIKDTRIRTSVEDRIENLKHSLDEGNIAPFFSARSIQNQLINRDTLLGKNVLLTFWATWCKPCIEELPHLKQINEEYKIDSLVIIAVSLDKDSTKMANMVSERKLNWVHIFNNTSILDAYRINPIPATFLIDEKGVIIYNTVYRENETSDLEILKSLLKQKFKH